MSEELANNEGRWFDRLGAGLGIACAVHCLAMPLLIGVLPFLGLSWLASQTAETWFVSALVMTALIGVLWGMKRHGSVRVIATFAAAVALVGAGQALHEEGQIGHILTILGSFAIAGAHLLNTHLCKTCPGSAEDNCCDH